MNPPQDNLKKEIKKTRLLTIIIAHIDLIIGISFSIYLVWSLSKIWSLLK